MTNANKVVSDSDGFGVNVATAFAVVRLCATGVGAVVALRVAGVVSLRVDPVA